jgi:hypothetical protein
VEQAAVEQEHWVEVLVHLAAQVAQVAQVKNQK